MTLTSVRLLLPLLLVSATASAAPDVMFTPTTASKCLPRVELHPPVTIKRVKEAMSWLAEQTCRRIIVPQEFLDRPLTFDPDDTAMSIEYDLDRVLAGAGLGRRSETAIVVTGTPRISVEQYIQCDQPGHCAIERTKFDLMLGHLSELASDARIVPWVRDGHAHGFKLYAVRPGSAYERIGFRNGDLLLTVNGIEIDTPEKALEIYSKMREAQQLRLGIERNKLPLVLVLDIR